MTRPNSEYLLRQGMNLMARVLASLEEATPKEEAELKVLDHPILQMYMRSRSLYEGTHILIEARLAEEALVLARSLYEESLRLMHLAKEGERRWSYTARWLMDAIDHKRGLVREGPLPRDQEKEKEFLRQLDDEETKLRGAKQRLGVVTEMRFTSVENLATIHNRNDDLWTYKLSHRMTHGSPIAQSFRSIKPASQDQEEPHRLYTRSDNPFPKLIAIVFSTKSMLHSHQSVAAIFEFIPPQKASHEFFAEIESLLKE